MERSAATSTGCRARVLGLGNDILADDGVGIEAVRRLRERGVAAEIVESAESGFRLLDYFLAAHRVVVIDGVETGGAPPGTIYLLGEGDLVSAPGTSPHSVGILETLSLARRLELPVADEVVLVAVEMADALTLGGEMHPAVREAVGSVVRLVEFLVSDELPALDGRMPPLGGSMPVRDGRA